MPDLANPAYQSMYLMWQFGHGYHLAEDAFTPSLRAAVQDGTGLRLAEGFDDWWVHPAGNPELAWPELLHLALAILHAEPTRLFVQHLHLDTLPPYTVREGVPLMERSVSGAKRVNAYAGPWEDYSAVMGIAGLFNPHRDEVFRNPPKRDSGDRFRLSGKDESCVVEGTWYDWVCFACNVLASPNTEAMCPDLYEPALKNDNY